MAPSTASTDPVHAPGAASSYPDPNNEATATDQGTVPGHAPGASAAEMDGGIQRSESPLSATSCELPEDWLRPHSPASSAGSEGFQNRRERLLQEARAALEQLLRDARQDWHPGPLEEYRTTRLVSCIVTSFEEAMLNTGMFCPPFWNQSLAGGGGARLAASYTTCLTREVTLRIIEKLIASDPHSAVFGAYHAANTAERAACVAQACHVAGKLHLYRSKLEGGQNSPRYLIAVEQMQALQELCEAALGSIAELHMRQGRAMLDDEKLIALELMRQRKAAEDAYAELFARTPPSAGHAAGDQWNYIRNWDRVCIQHGMFDRAQQPWPTRAVDGRCPREWNEMRRLEDVAEEARRL